MIQCTAYIFWRTEDPSHTTWHIKIAVQNARSLTQEIHKNSSNIAARMIYTGFVIQPSGTVAKTVKLLLKKLLCCWILQSKLYSFSKLKSKNFEILHSRLWQSWSYFTRSDPRTWEANLFSCPSVNKPNTSKTGSWVIIARSLHFCTGVSTLGTLSQWIWI